MQNTRGISFDVDKYAQVVDIIVLRFPKRSEDPFRLRTHQSFMILYLSHEGLIGLTYLCPVSRFITECLFCTFLMLCAVQWCELSDQV